MEGPYVVVLRRLSLNKHQIAAVLGLAQPSSVWNINTSARELDKAIGESLEKDNEVPCSFCSEGSEMTWKQCWDDLISPLGCVGCFGLV